MVDLFLYRDPEEEKEQETPGAFDTTATPGAENAVAEWNQPDGQWDQTQDWGSSAQTGEWSGQASNWDASVVPTSGQSWDQTEQ